MIVPLLLKLLAVPIDVIKEKEMKEPEVVWVFSIKAMQGFEPQEESSPAPGELSANFHPKSLDASISSGAFQNVNQCHVTMPIAQSQTHDPQRNEPRFFPFLKIIYTDTNVFSPPRSPLIREGHPYLLTALTNTSRTVAAVLSVLARNPVICVSTKVRDIHSSR
jgi:hypothetical protein